MLIRITFPLRLVFWLDKPNHCFTEFDSPHKGESHGTRCVCLPPVPTETLNGAFLQVAKI